MRELTENEKAVQTKLNAELVRHGFEPSFYRKGKMFQVLKPIVSKTPDVYMYFLLGSVGLIKVSVDTSITDFMSFVDCTCNGTMHIRRNLPYAQAKKIVYEATNVEYIKFVSHIPVMSMSPQARLADLVYRGKNIVLKNMIKHGLVSENHVMYELVKQTNMCLTLIDLPGTCKITDTRHHGNVLVSDVCFRNKSIKRKEANANSES